MCFLGNNKKRLRQDHRPRGGGWQDSYSYIAIYRHIYIYIYKLIVSTSVDFPKMSDSIKSRNMHRNIVHVSQNPDLKEIKNIGNLIFLPSLLSAEAGCYTEPPRPTQDPHRFPFLVIDRGCTAD